MRGQVSQARGLKRVCSCSDQTKANIRSALRRMWGERLKLKKLREKLLSPWAETIAEAARKGASDQQELQWDCYDKIKESGKWAAVQAKATAKVRATKAKAEKMARLAEKRKELERKAKAREVKRKNRKSKEEREELLIAQGLKLKEKLTKVIY